MWRVLYYSYSDGWMFLAEISSTLAQENHKIYRSEECESMPRTDISMKTFISDSILQKKCPGHISPTKYYGE